VLKLNIPPKTKRKIQPKIMVKNVVIIVLLVVSLYYLINFVFGFEYGHYVWAPTFYEAVAINFILGLATGATCTTLCAMVLIPYVTQKFSVLKAAFKASFTFSVFRLLMYLALATAAFYLGSTILESLTKTWIKGIIVVLSFVIVLYGMRTSYNWPPLWFRPKKSFFGSSHGFSAFLGMASGVATICPTLWMAIVYTALMKTIFMSLTVITSFWLGTTFWILLLGTFSVKLRKIVKTKEGFENFRKACGMVLLSIGIVYILLAVTT